MTNQSSRQASVISLGDTRPARGGFSNREKPGAIPSEPVLSLLPDMSHTNGRGVVEIVAQTLRQHG